ncbi:MAG: EFR1 family ferrodoxin [Spirochaetes bacterium]|nr:EFR1 family ferrodoxin [Spirochaetota bacterium]
MEARERSLRASIILCSPHGNTLKVAEAARKRLCDLGVHSLMVNLAGRGWDALRHFDYSEVLPADLLIFAFPVYAWRIVKPMEIILTNLPKSSNGSAGMLVTYGGCTSGRALMQAEELLSDKGYATLGAAKIVASHSNILEDDSYPLIPDPDVYRNHPDGRDMEAVNILITGIIDKLKTTDPPRITPAQLRPQFGLVRLMLRSPVYKRYGPSFPPGVRLDTGRCIRCGRCVTACPVNVIEMDEYPRRIGECIKCHNCKRVCPAGAIVSTGLWRKIVFHFGLQKIHELPSVKGEKPMTQVFI